MFLENSSNCNQHGHILTFASWLPTMNCSMPPHLYTNILAVPDITVAQWLHCLYPTLDLKFGIQYAFMVMLPFSCIYALHICVCAFTLSSVVVKLKP